jgi:hypothetical protein
MVQHTHSFNDRFSSGGKIRTLSFCVKPDIIYFTLVTPFELFKAQWYYGKAMSEYWPIINLYITVGLDERGFEPFCLPLETERNDRGDSQLQRGARVEMPVELRPIALVIGTDSSWR